MDARELQTLRIPLPTGESTNVDRRGVFSAIRVIEKSEFVGWRRT